MNSLAILSLIGTCLHVVLGSDLPLGSSDDLAERIEQAPNSPTLNLGNVYPETGKDDSFPQRRSSSRSDNSLSGLSTSSITLPNDGKWISVQFSGECNSFLATELVAKITQPSFLDISDMDFGENVFELYEKNNRDQPIGTSNLGRAQLSSTGQVHSESVGRGARWSSGRIMLEPGEHHILIKVVYTKEVDGGGNIGLRLGAADVISAPLVYKNGRPRRERSISSKQSDWDPMVPARRKLKLFLVKSKFPTNSINRACEVFGGLPASVSASHLSQVSQYLLEVGKIARDTKVFIGTYEEIVSTEKSALYIKIGHHQGIVSRIQQRPGMETLVMESVLCEANEDLIEEIIENQSLPQLHRFSVRPKTKAQKPPGQPRRTVSEPFYEPMSTEQSKPVSNGRLMRTISDDIHRPKLSRRYSKSSSSSSSSPTSSSSSSSSGGSQYRRRKHSSKSKSSSKPKSILKSSKY